MHATEHRSFDGWASATSRSWSCTGSGASNYAKSALHDYTPLTSYRRPHTTERGVPWTAR